jgi:hypothetical protein
MVLQKFGSNLHELEPISRHDAMSLTKSRIYLKHVFGRMLGGDLGLCVGFRVFSDADDCIVRIDVDDIEGARGVFHPKVERPFLRKDEQHAAELRQLVAIHEAESAACRGVDDFDGDVDGFAGLRVNDDVGRRGRRGRAGWEEERDEKEGKRISPYPQPQGERGSSLKCIVTQRLTSYPRSLFRKSMQEEACWNFYIMRLFRR